MIWSRSHKKTLARGFDLIYGRRAETFNAIIQREQKILSSARLEVVVNQSYNQYCVPRDWKQSIYKHNGMQILSRPWANSMAVLSIPGPKYKRHHHSKHWNQRRRFSGKYYFEGSNHRHQYTPPASGVFYIQDRSKTQKRFLDKYSLTPKLYIKPENGYRR